MLLLPVRRNRLLQRAVRLLDGLMRFPWVVKGGGESEAMLAQHLRQCARSPTNAKCRLELPQATLLAVSDELAMALERCSAVYSWRFTNPAGADELLDAALPKSAAIATAITAAMSIIRIGTTLKRK